MVNLNSSALSSDIRGISNPSPGFGYAYSLDESVRCYFFGGIMENGKKQMLTLEDRRRLIIDGIINVESFSEDYMELSSVLGRIEVEGKDLKIEELRQDGGKILIIGEIGGIFYRENKKAKGIFSKYVK